VEFSVVVFVLTHSSKTWLMSPKMKNKFILLSLCIAIYSKSYHSMLTRIMHPFGPAWVFVIGLLLGTFFMFIYSPHSGDLGDCMFVRDFYGKGVLFQLQSTEKFP
jgi:hypothetical protein